MVARFLEKLGMEPIILNEQASGGRTIADKRVHYSNVDFAVVLLTPDAGEAKRGFAVDLNAALWLLRDQARAITKALT